MSIGTPKSPHATRVLMLGSGELGKEVVIELQRFGVEVIACDRYADAPAMQVAHRSHVIDMLDRAALRAVVEKEQPHLIVPEIEAIATEVLELKAGDWLTGGDGGGGVPPPPPPHPVRSAKAKPAQSWRRLRGDAAPRSKSIIFPPEVTEILG